MIVVADSSPLIVLLNIGHVEVLPALFQQIIIPQAVADELKLPKRPQRVRDYYAAKPEWLDIRRPSHVETIPLLHAGETEALSLALELNANFLLVDERLAYRAAVERKINAIGTIRVLESAADSGLIDLADAFAKIKQTDF